MQTLPAASLGLLVFISAANGLSAPHQAEAKLGKACITTISPESTNAAKLRHAKIAERRKGSVVIVHRGASAFAPENTLEAYAAAMDYGADGCEIDLRHTVDGILVLSHDETVERCFDSVGIVDQFTYRELTEMPPRFIYGSATRQTRMPTFAALLELARQREMLLHLDVKEPGLEDEIIRLLDATEMWDHVVAVNDYNAAKILKHPRLKLLAYKASGLNEARFDMDPSAVEAALAQPGNMIMVDDPRVATRVLKRNPSKKVPLPPTLFADLPPSQVLLEAEQKPFRSALRELTNRVDANSPEALEAFLKVKFPEYNQPNGNAEFVRQRTKRTIERAWAAQRLGQIGSNSAATRKALEELVTQRSLHNDWIYHGMDGIAAVHALTKLNAKQSIPVLREMLFRIDPQLEKTASPMFPNYPPAWRDIRLKSTIVTALGQIPCVESQKVLFDYLALNEKDAHELAPPLRDEVSASLLRQNLSLTQIEKLLRSANSAVRGEAILGCIDHPTKQRMAALAEAAPWALTLPRAGK